MITKREAAIISAYTGFLLGEFSEMHGLAEEILKRPIFTHEFADRALCDELQQAVKPLFLALPVEGER